MITSTVRMRHRERGGGIGTSADRPEGLLKTKGEFAFSSDLHVEGMVWGQTVRSPHPYARIRSLSMERALAVPGVMAAMTHRQIPGMNRFGLVVADQPVLAEDIVRFHGEPVALVAATTPAIAREAARLVEIDYEVMEPLIDPRRALEEDAPILHADGNLVRHLVIRRGDRHATAPAVVTGEYEVDMQDQAALGTESGLAVPSADGGVELYTATQWLHVDRNQLATVLDLPPELVRLQLAGVGGAFGAKEDLSVQAHLCLLALATGRPVKMVYSRNESFFGHVHRHPAVLQYEHGADMDGRLVYVRSGILLDGGAYASTTAAVTSNAGCFSVGPYACPNVDIEVHSVYTNNPPAGAMRGFGAVQAAFAHESQMDRLAMEVGISPLEVRRRNALRPGDPLPTGQDAGALVPVLDLLDRLEAVPLPETPSGQVSIAAVPGGAGNVTRGEGVVRGVGYGVGFKNAGMPEGISDFATARVTLFVEEGEPVVEVYTAAAELGQGIDVVQVQIARTELGIQDVRLRPPDTRVGSAGTSSASRQTYMTGGAVRRACQAVKRRVLRLANERVGHRHPGLLEADEGFTLREGTLFGPSGEAVATVAQILGGTRVTEEREFHNRSTVPLGEDGQGNAHLQLIYASHRAVVDVDVETGLVRVVELVVAQDVGRAINPLAVEGQMEGGTAQGLGLALMERLQIEVGQVRNPTFADYLVPTILDVPRIRTEVLELPDPDAPYGVKGAGEPSTISSTPAIVAAIRAATGQRLVRVPVRPDDIVGLGS